jgi:hypothetical protein
MVWDVSELNRRFDSAQNAEALSFLVQAHPSAHSDLSDELLKSTAGLSGVGSYCPDVQSYAFVLLHTESNLIFGMALGMNDMVFKLPANQIQQARMDGGEPRQDIGTGWIRFNPFAVPTDMPGTRAKLHRWCRVALTNSTTEL